MEFPETHDTCPIETDLTQNSPSPTKTVILSSTYSTWDNKDK